MLRPVFHVLKEGFEFVGTVKKDIYTKDVAYLICNKDFLIEDITSSCINIIGLDLRAITMKKIYLTDLFTDIK